jgi:hypothetical protein
LNVMTLLTTIVVRGGAGWFREVREVRGGSGQFRGTIGR